VRSKYGRRINGCKRSNLQATSSVPSLRHFARNRWCCIQHKHAYVTFVSRSTSTIKAAAAACSLEQADNLADHPASLSASAFCITITITCSFSFAMHKHVAPCRDNHQLLPKSWCWIYDLDSVPRSWKAFWIIVLKTVNKAPYMLISFLSKCA
jgi:hypothetical protein